MSTPEKPEKLTIELGDIIKILAPTNQSLNDNIYLVDYIDSSQIELVDTATFTKSTLNIIDGNLTDESITGIEILDKPAEPGYARQHNLLPGTWVNLYFTNADMPVIITGEITELDKDMIEVKTYPDNKVIYIDFAYKGLPKNLPLESVKIRDKPTTLARDENIKPEVENTEVENTEIENTEDYVLDEVPAEDSTTIVQSESQEDIKAELANLIRNADKIVYGDDMQTVTEVIELSEEKQRYGIEKQTNDLLDDLLASVPTSERTNKLMNKISMQINRFKELRLMFSQFDEYGSISGFLKKGANYKPLIQHIENLDQKLFWLLPVGVNKKKLYNVNMEEAEEFSEIIPLDLYTQLSSEIQVVDAYKTNSMPSDENKYAYLYKELNPYLTPFQEPMQTSEFLLNKPVNTNLNILLDNTNDNFNSLTAHNDSIIKYQYLFTGYNVGLDRLEVDIDVTNPSAYKVDRIPMTANDTLNLKSLVMLPEPMIRFSCINLPGTNIMRKSNLASNFLNYWEIFNKSTFINNVVIDKFSTDLTEKFNKTSDKLQVDEYTDRFMQITEYLCDEDLNESDKFNKFLQTIIPKTRVLFNQFKKYIKDRYSLYTITQVLEPFMIYYDDISYKQYSEIAAYLDNKLIEYKKNLIRKTKEFNLLKLQRYGVKYNANPLVSIFKDNNSLIQDIMQEYRIIPRDKTLYDYKLLPYSISEILFKMYKSDNLNLYANAIAVSTLPLHMDIDIDKLLSSEKQEINEAQMQSSDEKCSKYVLSKKYGSKEELEIDNDNPAVFFDNDYDTTRYDILKEYKNEQDSMPPEEFEPFLVEKLQETIGLNADAANREANAMLLGKKIVKDGDFALIMDKETDGDEFSKVFYERVNNNWQKANVDAKSFADNNTMFCNVNETCFNINQKCLSNDMATNEIKKAGIMQMLNEFDNQYNLTSSELNSLIKGKFQLSQELLPRLIKYKLQQVMKYNKTLYNIGTELVENDIIESPFASLRDLILGQSDFVKKQNDIIRFVNKYARAALEEEEIYWYYCNETGVKLMPAFIYTLAEAFTTQQNANDYNVYKRALDRICADQGEISEDGNAYVDKYSGYKIREIEFDTDEGYEDSGYKMVSRSIMEEDLGNVVFSEVSGASGEKTKLDPDSETINNIISTITNFMGINLKDKTSFIIRQTQLILSKTISSEEEYKIKAENHLKRKGKALPEYKDIKNSSLILITLGYILIAIQITIPSIRTRKTFPGCVKSFSGFPLDGDADKSALLYISCIANKIKSTIEPWNSLKKINEDGIMKRVEAIIRNYIISNGEIKELFSEKLKYMQLNESDYIPIEHDISNWVNFLPPLLPLNLKTQQPVTKAMESELLDKVKSGSLDQFNLIRNVDGKIIYNSLQIQEKIQNIINSKDPIFTNSKLEPFLVNTCCNDSEMVSTIDYFTDIDPEIREYNLRTKELNFLVQDLRMFAIAPFFFDPDNTREIFPPLSLEYSEETIYRAFIVYCKYNNNLPLDPELMRICTSKPENFDSGSNVKQQIEELKRLGKNFDNDMLIQLMNVVNKNNIFIPAIEPNITTPIQKLRNIIQKIQEMDNDVVSKEFIEKMLNAIDTFDDSASEDSPAIRILKNFLATSHDTILQTISAFMTKYNKKGKKDNSAIMKFFTTLTEWSQIRSTSYQSSEDATLHQIIDFIKNISTDVIVTYPEIIINKNDYSSIKIPKHWNISALHEMDIKKMVRLFYQPLKQFYGETIMETLLNKIENDLQIYKELIDNTPAFTTILGLEDKRPLFNAELVYLLYKYYFINIIYQYILITDSPKFVRQEQPLIALDIAEQAMISTNVELEEIDSGTITEIDIVRGESLELKEKTASLLSAFINMFNSSKKLMALNYDDIMEKVLRSKEKEKDSITKFLKDLSDEERELEDMFKNNKLERWSKGLQKGVTQYVKGTYDEEREALDKLIMLEREIGENNAVSEMNLNIYSLELNEEATRAAEIEQEAYDMSDIVNDDDYGDQDGDEAY